jgi:hypothetical protein
VISDDFDVLMSKIKNKIERTHFQAKSYFEKHPAPQS